MGVFIWLFSLSRFVGGSFCIASRLKCQRCVRDLILIVSSPLHMYNMLVLSSDISSSSERNVLSWSNIIHIWKNTKHVTYSVRSFLRQQVQAWNTKYYVLIANLWHDISVQIYNPISYTPNMPPSKFNLGVTHDCILSCKIWNRKFQQTNAALTKLLVPSMLYKLVSSHIKCRWVLLVKS